MTENKVPETAEEITETVPEERPEHDGRPPMPPHGGHRPPKGERPEGSEGRPPMPPHGGKRPPMGEKPEEQPEEAAEEEKPVLTAEHSL